MGVYRKICDKVEDGIVKILVKVQKKDVTEAESKVIAYRTRRDARKKARWARLRGKTTKQV